MKQLSLREARKEAGLTVERLAHLAGVTSGTIRNLELGRTPRLDTARRVATALNRVVDEVFPQDEAAA